MKPLDFLRNRVRAYSHVFKKNDESVKFVMKDLAKFCRANETTFDIDDRVSAVLQGRREVWLRIRQHCDLSPDELLELYGGK